MSDLCLISGCWLSSISAKVSIMAVVSCPESSIMMVYIVHGDTVTCIWEVALSPGFSAATLLHARNGKEAGKPGDEATREVYTYMYRQCISHQAYPILLKICTYIPTRDNTTCTQETYLLIQMFTCTTISYEATRSLHPPIGCSQALTCYIESSKVINKVLNVSTFISAGNPDNLRQDIVRDFLFIGNGFESLFNTVLTNPANGANSFPIAFRQIGM